MTTEFTPIAALLGGGLIGLASVALMLFRGRIMGATGLLSGLISPASFADWRWRAVLFAGMIATPLTYLLATGMPATIDIPVGLPMLAIGGFIVGLGATLGSGCTSGHGVCGLARLSPRSIAATLTFMTTTGLTVFAVRHLIGG